MSIDRLSAADQLMLRSGATWPQHVAALAILDGDGLVDADGAFLMDVAREAIRSRLGLVPRFRQVLVQPRRGLGGPLWVDAPAVDLSNHINVRSIAGPGGEAELLATVEELRRLPLDGSRPLWAMWFLTGVEDRRIGLFVVLHHAIADGVAALTTLGAFLDGGPERPGPGAPISPAPMPSTRELFVDNARRTLAALASAAPRLLRPRRTLRDVRRSWPAVRELMGETPATETTLNRFVGPDRNLALIRTTMAEVRQIARTTGATPNDVLLAVTAGGIRSALVARGEPVDRITIRMYVPVSLRRGRERHARSDIGNRISQMAVPIPLAEQDPGRRLRRIAAETARRRRRPRPSLGTWFRGGARTARLILKSITGQRVNTTTAYLRGPDAQLSFAGAPILELFPILPLIGNVTLGVGVVTYAGTFGIGIAADRAAYPDLGPFVAGAKADLAALRLGPVAAERAAVARVSGSPPDAGPGGPLLAGAVHGS
jgi:WS/DGAT/MGAT family acyltransferase